MAYTPELEQVVSAYVRRVAWALRMPMTVTLEDLVLYVAERTDPAKVCPSCRDRSHCPECYLNRPPRPTGRPLPELLKGE